MRLRHRSSYVSKRSGMSHWLRVHSKVEARLLHRCRCIHAGQAMQNLSPLCLPHLSAMLRNCAYVDAYANSADIDLEIMHSSNDVFLRATLITHCELKLDCASFPFFFLFPISKFLQQIIKRKNNVSSVYSSPDKTLPDLLNPLDSKSRVRG